MQSIYKPKLILPESLTFDEQINALAAALDAQLKLISTLSKQDLHLPRLDELTGSILDLLAWQFHVDHYNPLVLNDTQKRNLIRRSIEQHRLKGTIYAVEQVVKEFFKDGRVEEIGDYLFRIRSKGYTSSPEAFTTFLKMLWDAKNVRSWLADIELDLSEDSPMNLGAGTALAIGGRININLATPKDQINQLDVGTMLAIGGELTIAPAHQNNQKVILHAGSGVFIEGEITIGTEDKPVLASWIKENPTGDLLISDIGIARGDYVLPDYEPEPVTTEDNLVKLFFGFPISKHRRYRGIAMPDPRPDLTVDEMKAIGDYAARHKIIMNAAGEYSNGVFAAAIKERTTEIIKGEPHLKAATLAQDERARNVLSDLRGSWT